MRILEWNVGHQTRQRLLPATAGAALVSLHPDVVVLTEYVADQSHPGALRPKAVSPAAVPNWLHLRLPTRGCDLVGLRVPRFNEPGAREQYWSWFEETVLAMRPESAVLIGDMNADPSRARRTTPAGADGRATNACSCFCCLRVTLTRRGVCVTRRITAVHSSALKG